MRLELTRKTDLALRAMQALHAEKARLPGRKLAALIGTTTPFVFQVISPLLDAGWVDSRPGPTGGYALAVDPTGLTLLDVVERIEGPIISDRCVMAGGPCSGAVVCSVHDAWIEARGALRTAFAQVAVVH